MPTKYRRVRLWSTSHAGIGGETAEAIATCLARAFSAGLWATTPLPVGDCHDRHSARGILAEMGERARVLAVSDVDDGTSVLGCVVGVVLDGGLIASYGLGDFGADAGDGLLAYIGIVPEAQGARVAPLQDDTFEVRWGPSRNPSLASLLFEGWLALPTVSACPNVFVRTRKSIKPVLYLLDKNGFSYRGGFRLSFRGVRQSRLVFGRNGKGAPQQQNDTTLR